MLCGGVKGEEGEAERTVVEIGEAERETDLSVCRTSDLIFMVCFVICLDAIMK